MLLFFSCSTRKNTVFHRTFHNISSRFNGYFNANEIIKESVKRLEKGHQDDYTTILPVFVYGNEAESKMLYPDMDKAIKKVSLVIQRHTIKDRKSNEIAGAVKWIDDCYMILGKAHVYKHDYFSGLEAFDYVAKKYKDFPAAKYNGMLWSIRVNNEVGSYSKSQELIDFLNNDKALPKKHYKEFAAVSADYFIRINNTDASIKQLSKAAAISHKKLEKARFSYILAQLYKSKGDSKKAQVYFSQVIKLKPDYEMYFNAKLNKLTTFSAEQNTHAKNKRELIKMISDEKNKEYLDQVYYALATIEEKENNMNGTVVYLKKSVASSVDNKNQKALSYLKLGDIHFTTEKYPPARSYYDSTLIFLSKDFQNYDLIADRKESLNSLVDNLNIITLEDSLQKLALMTEEQRAAVINSIIKKQQDEDKKKEEERLRLLQNPSLANQQNQKNNPNQRFQQNFNGPSSFYFYNPTTVNYGITEFVKKWGNRKNEDNWRRLNKESDNDFQTQNQNDDSDTSKTKTTLNASVNPKTPKSHEQYLKNIPFTEEQKKKSNEKIIEAYYNSGLIYKERFQLNKNSAAMFTTLNDRFPENKYKLNAYFQLYRLYLTMNNQEKSDYYKNLILNNYPNTEYAKIIQNPEYAKLSSASRSEVENFYNETFYAYNDGNYPEVIARCRQADSVFATSKLAPKFDFLKAMAIGKSGDKNSFEAELVRITIEHPKTQESIKAQELLDLIAKIKNPSLATNVAKVDSTKKDTYIFKEDDEYFCAIIIKSSKADVSQFKISLSDFNSENYSVQNLTVTANFLDTQKQMVYVSKFIDKKSAMDYYNFLKSDKCLKQLEMVGGYDLFVISSQNFAIFYKEKSVEEYLAFFNEKFLK